MNKKIRSLVDGIANGEAGTIVEYPAEFAKMLVDRGDAEYVKDEKKPEVKKMVKESKENKTKSKK